MQFDWWSLGIQTINFLVVVWLLSRFLYRPVRRMIEARETADNRLAAEANAKVDAAEAARRDYERKMAEFAETQRGKETELHSAMEAERDAILQEAREKADAMMAESRERLDRDRAAALKDLQQEIAALAADLARKALTPDLSADAALQRAMAHLDGLPAQELAELRNDASGPDATIAVVTAAPLDEDTQAVWRAALSERMGAAAAVTFDADAALIGGVKIGFPHADLNMTVDRRLRDAAKEAMS